MKVEGVSVDFVGLRAEEYASGSRIPEVRLGTAEEDALRRDLTINALFYRVDTGAIEDLTGRGLDGACSHSSSLAVAVAAWLPAAGCCWLLLPLPREAAV